MRFKKPLTICIGTQTTMSNEKITEIITDALLEENFMPKEFYPGSTIKITINLEFSITDYDI